MWPRWQILLILAVSAWGADTNPARLPADYAARVATLEQARRDHPRDAGVLDSLAGSYAMSGRYGKAIEAVEALRALQPGEPAPLLRLARLHAWNGHGRAAIRYYGAYLKLRPEDRTATIELIRQRRYRGDYEQAEKLCDRLLAVNAGDAEVLTLKSEVLHWAGNRSRGARASAESALAAEPESPDARVAHVYALNGLGERQDARREFDALRDEVTMRGGPPQGATYADAYHLLTRELGESSQVMVQIPYSVYNDSDAIHDVSGGLRLVVPVREDHHVELNVNEYTSSAPQAGIFTAGRNRSAVREFTAGGTLQPAPGATLSLLVGASALSGDGSPRPTFDFQAAIAPVDRWTFTFAASRAFLKVTPRSMDLGISSYSGSGGARYAFDSRTSISLQADRRWWSDGNHSASGEAVLERVLQRRRSFGLRGGLLTHGEGFARDNHFAAGFFTPDLYLRHDAFLHARVDLGRGVVWEVRSAGGAQRITQEASYRPSWEVTTWVSARLGGKLRLSGSYQRRNYSLLSRDGWYQGFYISLGGQP
jgi:tetratricopeptide (TPR) repeat protein